MAFIVTLLSGVGAVAIYLFNASRKSGIRDKNVSKSLAIDVSAGGCNSPSAYAWPKVFRIIEEVNFDILKTSFQSSCKDRGTKKTDTVPGKKGNGDRRFDGIIYENSGVPAEQTSFLYVSLSNETGNVAARNFKPDVQTFVLLYTCHANARAQASSVYAPPLTLCRWQPSY